MSDFCVKCAKTKFNLSSNQDNFDLQIAVQTRLFRTPNIHTLYISNYN